jgi:hypothetical protein
MLGLSSTAWATLFESADGRSRGWLGIMTSVLIGGNCAALWSDWGLACEFKVVGGLIWWFPCQRNGACPFYGGADLRHGGGGCHLSGGAISSLAL